QPSAPPAPSAPVVHIAAPAEGAAVSASPVTVSGTIDDKAVTSVQIAGQAFTASNGSFSGTPPPAAGANAITVTPTNPGGTGSATVHVSYAPPSATPPPRIRVDAPAENATVTSDHVTVTGAVENAGISFVTVDEQEIMVDAGGAFSAGVVLQPGPNTIAI